MSFDPSGTETGFFPAGPADRSERRRRSRRRVPALTVLYHPEVDRAGERAVLAELGAGRDAALSRYEPGFGQPGGLEHRPLADPFLSRTPLRLAPGEQPGAVLLDPAGARAPLSAGGHPVSAPVELSAAEVERGVVLELAGRVVLLLHNVTARTLPAVPAFGLVGESEGIVRVRQEIARVADLDVPVLLRGETGTGKELVAAAIHRVSPRRAGPWLSLNLGAVPATLAPSELFGVVQGAFTGAVKSQAGYFQRAHGGTLFLDEVAEAPGEVQVALLRVLETGEVNRLGSREPQRVDVRLIAATDADLEEAIRQGRFRAPLLHRLAGYEIVLPPLRERREDFGRLLVHFLRQELRATGEEWRLARDPKEPPWLPGSIVARLARLAWPGNVRELKNVARAIVIESRGAESVEVGPQLERLLREAARPAEGNGGRQTPAEGSPAARRAPAAAYRRPSEVSEEELFAALRANAWEIKATAAQLGIARPSLYLLIDRCAGIRRASDLGAEEILASLERCGGNLDAAVADLEVSRRGLEQRLRQLGLPSR
jgi:two-component system, NtrC family, nitrogen regulation response regulator GlnG